MLIHYFITLVVLMAFRVFYIVNFSDEIKLELNPEILSSFFYMSLRFDMATFSYIALPITIISIILNSLRLHQISASISKSILILFYFTLVTTSILSIFYIQEYNSTFNHFIFLGIYDDKWASLLTFIKEYKPTLSLMTIALLIFTLVKIVISTSNQTLLIPTKNKKIAILILISFLILILVTKRGGIYHRELSRKWSGVTTDPFFNNLILNPINSLYFSINDYRQLINEGGTSQNPYALPHNYHSILHRETLNSNLERPSHIFLIIMESYDSWPKQDKYRSLNISNTYHNLSEKSSHTLNTTPASHSTFNSVASIISGIPYSGVNMRHFIGKNSENPLSLPSQLKSLGYSSHFFYGGLLSWQKIGVFMNEQGVDHLHSGELLKERESSDIWGINDRQLFELVEEKLSNNSLNIILTSSYHPPYNIDLSKEGFNSKKFKEEYYKNYSSLHSLLDYNTLGHHWYSDNILGDFINKTKENHPNSLFIITGDHYSRRYLHNQPNLFELTQVPIIFHGNNLKEDWSKKNASHLDIAPTLMDFITPTKYKYCSFGTSLFQHDSKPKIGFKTMRVGNKIWKGDFNRQYSYYDHKTENEKSFYPPKYTWEPISDADLTYYNSYMGLAWQMVVNPEKVNTMKLCK